MSKIKTFIKKYWREMAVVVMFFILLSGVNEAKETAFRAYDYAADAADYAADAASIAEDAYYAASDASDYASDAADNARYCQYLY